MAKPKQRVHVGVEIDGQIPTRCNKQYGYSRRLRRTYVYIPKEAKEWRMMIAEKVKKKFKKFKKRQPSQLLDVCFKVFSNRITPDLDTAYHQLQDALTKDAFGIHDRDVGIVVPRRTKLKKGESPRYYIGATYLMEEKNGKTNKRSKAVKGFQRLGKSSNKKNKATD